MKARFLNAVHMLRASAVIAHKELVELRRQPGVLALVVLGPFAVLAAFGLGYRNEPLALQTIVVAPADGPYEEAIDRYADSIAEYVVPLAFTPDVFAATADLKAGRADVVIILPADPVNGVAEGERAEIAILHDSIDPIEQIGIEFAAEIAVRELNSTVVTAALDALLVGIAESDPEELVDSARAVLDEEEITSESFGDIDQLVRTGVDLDATVLARPFLGNTQPLLRKRVSPEGYVAPGATALLLQHLGVSLAALSLVRDERRGVLAEYQIGPTSISSIILGKLGALSFLAFTTGALVIAGQVKLLGVPQNGSLLALGATLLGLATASVSIGFVLASVGRTELAATQAAMIVLLLGLFFSGFLLDTDLFRNPFRSLGFLAPSYPGVASLRQIQLRGVWPDRTIPTTLIVQTVMGVAISSLLLRKRWRRD